MIGEGFAKDCLLRQSVSCEPELSLKRLKMPTVGGLLKIGWIKKTARAGCKPKRWRRSKFGMTGLSCGQLTKNRGNFRERPR